MLPINDIEVNTRRSRRPRVGRNPRTGKAVADASPEATTAEEATLEVLDLALLTLSAGAVGLVCQSSFGGREPKLAFPHEVFVVPDAGFDRVLECGHPGAEGVIDLQRQLLFDPCQCG